MSEQKSNLVEIINKIEKNQILLPDFQREFVWKDEDQQKQLVASVLCKMPVGSILLLESDPDDYAAKVIGCSKKQVATTQINGEVEFLLDGQQRLTVLTNVFSNIIHDNCPKVSELIAPMALKRRFFLKLPKWKDRPDKEEDWFGIGNLEFPIENPNTDLPPFLTSQILKYIHVESFNANDKKPYNPAEKLTPLLDEYCTSFRDGYLIPMFLMATPIGKNKSSIVLRFGDIIEKVAKAIASEIKAAYRDYATTSEKDEFTKYIFADDADNIYSQLDKTQAFDDEVDARSKIWTSQIKEYLSSCINSIFLSQIVVEASQRARAIDIYENLNRGGVCLNTFDLIMARVAKVNKENFSSRMHKLMMSQKNYPEKVLPDKMRVILSSKIQNHTYNATENTGCYNASNNDLNSKYVDIFLDVLSIYSYVPDLNPDTIKLDHIKKGFILNLKPEQIDQNCEKTITAIDRSMFFLQTRCGIRTLQEVNYALVVVLIAVVFLEDTYFYDRDVHDLLEGWYWSVLFSGEYDKDQNTTFINNLKNMLKTGAATGPGSPHADAGHRFGAHAAELLRVSGGGHVDNLAEIYGGQVADLSALHRAGGRGDGSGGLCTGGIAHCLGDGFQDELSQLGFIHISSLPLTVGKWRRRRPARSGHPFRQSGPASSSTGGTPARADGRRAPAGWRCRGSWCPGRRA